MTIAELLKQLGIEIPKDKEAEFDKFFNENYTSITEVDKITTARDNYKSQLETAQTALKEFEGVDVNDLQGKISLLNGELETAKNEHLAKIANMEFDNCLNTAISSTGARNAKAVMALLDVDTLKASKNQSEDIKKALEAVKADNDYLFTPPHQNPTPTGGATTPPSKTYTKDELNKMSPSEINQNWADIQKSL